VTRRNPSAHWTSALARTVAADLASRGWRLERVMSDNASEFRAATFQATIAMLKARHTFIRAGRPQTNGCVERVQQTILDECWKPAFARYLIPKQTGLRLDLERCLTHTIALLQHRTRPHRQMDPRPHPRAGPREGQAVAQEALMRRHISGTGHPRSCGGQKRLDALLGGALPAPAFLGDGDGRPRGHEANRTRRTAVRRPADQGIPGVSRSIDCLSGPRLPRTSFSTCTPVVLFPSNQ